MIPKKIPKTTAFGKNIDSKYNIILKKFVNTKKLSKNKKRVIEISAKYEPYIDEINPAVMHSATMKRSLSTMLDGYSKAPKYNTSSMLNCAFGTAVDSVLAVKELVFDTKQTTLAELKEALANNWEGYEKLRLKALNCRLKYGNGVEEADRYAFAIA